MSATEKQRPYPLLWIVLAVLSTNISVPAMRQIIHNAGLARNGIALAVAIVFGVLFALAINGLELIERRASRFTVAALLGAFLIILWYCSKLPFDFG